MLYFSAAGLVACSIIYAFTAKEPNQEDSGVSADKDGDSAKALSGLLLLAGVIGLGISLLYFSFNVFSDWRQSRGIFYPVEMISADNLPQNISNDYPPPPLKEK
jgi:hypothetical protein